MAPRLAKSNDELLRLLMGLRKASRKQDAPIWADIADRLEKPSRSWAEVNLSRIERVAPKGSTVLVPGKVLGAGELTHAVTVAAFQFSASSREKIHAAGGKTVSIKQLIELAPKGTGVKIVS